VTEDESGLRVDDTLADELVDTSINRRELFGVSPMAGDSTQTIQSSWILRKCLATYLVQIRRIWKHLPASFRRLSLGRLYGRHLHALVRLLADRSQYFGTFFLRNRAELELMCRLLVQKAHGASLNISVLACSKGAEVYSILWAIRTARPDLRLSIHAVDISRKFWVCPKGVYCVMPMVPEGAKSRGSTERGSGLEHSRDQTRLFSSA
jgi:hypothetical protein